MKSSVKQTSRHLSLFYYIVKKQDANLLKSITLIRRIKIIKCFDLFSEFTERRNIIDKTMENEV